MRYYLGWSNNFILLFLSFFLNFGSTCNPRLLFINIWSTSCCFYVFNIYPKSESMIRKRVNTSYTSIYKCKDLKLRNSWDSSLNNRIRSQRSLVLSTILPVRSLERISFQVAFIYPFVFSHDKFLLPVFPLSVCLSPVILFPSPSFPRFSLSLLWNRVSVYTEMQDQ